MVKQLSLLACISNILDYDVTYFIIFLLRKNCFQISVSGWRMKLIFEYTFTWNLVEASRKKYVNRRSAKFAKFNFA